MNPDYANRPADAGGHSDGATADLGSRESAPCLVLWGREDFHCGGAPLLRSAAAWRGRDDCERAERNSPPAWG
jgi:hypothetical protein